MHSRTAAMLLVATLAAALSGCAVPTAQELVIDKKDAAGDSSATSDLGNARLAYLSYAATNGAAPRSAGELADFGYTPSEGASPVRILPGSNASAFCLDLASASGTYFKTTATAAPAEGQCSSSDL